MKWGNNKKTYAMACYICYFVVVAVVVIMLSVVRLHHVLNKNVKQRAFGELQSMAQTYATLAKKDAETQFAQLHVVGSIIESQSEIQENDLSAMWDLMEQIEEPTMIGIANMEGDAVDYQGNTIGNISGRTYFKDIVNGNATEKCVYLESSLRSEKPEILYAIPIYKEGKIEGVLFKSKNVSAIAEPEIMDIGFDGHSSLFIINSQGEIILVSDSKESNLLSDNLFDDSDHIKIEDITNDELRKNLQERVSGYCTFHHENEVKYAAYVPLNFGDYALFCMVDKNFADIKFEKNQSNIRNAIYYVTGMFFLVSLFAVFLMIMYKKKERQESVNRKFQYNGYKKIMQELTCPVYEYDIENDQLCGNKAFSETFSRRTIEKFVANTQTWKERHPEFNFNGLVQEIETVILEHKITSFESVIQNKSNEFNWIKSILVPVNDDNGKVIRVFGTILDTTREHIRFEKAVEIMSSMPTGLHRCCLSDPIHVEYIGEGLYRMLGYTAEEVDAIIGAKREYINLMPEEDREHFANYAIRLRQNGGVDTLEYRMICKDGSLLPVTETMEVKTGSDGIIYGYAVVTDIRKYKEKQKEADEKVERLELQLSEARLKVSTGQMQPHFLYNALASIREIILEDPEYASDLIYDFTTHLRACIKSMSNCANIPFSQEIENIKAYVSIEKMRFGDKLQVQYDISETDFEIIPLGIQPLVENAVRHGIYERGETGGIVKIQSFRDKNHVIVTVEDNGVGFDMDFIQKEVEQHKRDSTGLQNLIFRFENIMHADVRVESQLGVGTKITVSIPVLGGENHESNYCR